MSTKSYCNNFLCTALFFVFSRFYGKCECSRCGGFSSRSVIYSQAWACLHGVCVQLETGKRLWRQETCKSSGLVPGVCCHDLCAVMAIFVTADQNASNIVKSLMFYFHLSIFVIKNKQFLHQMFLLRSKSYMLKVHPTLKSFQLTFVKLQKSQIFKNSSCVCFWNFKLRLENHNDPYRNKGHPLCLQQIKLFQSLQRGLTFT